MHQRLNAIVMKAIWNIEKRQGRVTIQELVEEIKRNIGKEYHMGQRYRIIYLRAVMLMI